MEQLKRLGLRLLPGSVAARLPYYIRVTSRLTNSEFKLQFQDSRLGYLWALLKPLALFTVLYLVFGKMLRFGSVFQNFPIYLLIGLVLWIFFVNATQTAMDSIVGRGAVLRRIAFPPMILPASATLTAGVTFVLSLIPIALLIAWRGIVPRPDWLLILPLLAELYLFTLAFALVLAALYVQFRDVRQIWEVASQLLFYLTPIIYPLQLIPDWGQKLIFISPFAQIMQDIRGLVLYDERGQVITIRDVFSLSIVNELFPVVVIAVMVTTSLVYFAREQRWFAEKV